jgi:hypothetical protein
MKDKVTANRLAGAIAVFVAAANRSFTELPTHPVALPVAA